MSWDYAELSKMAKESGGPEQLVDILIDSGKKSMYPWIGVAALGGIAFTIGIQKIVNRITSKREKSSQEIEAVKQELIQGIKEYDETHPIENNKSEDKNNE